MRSTDEVAQGGIAPGSAEERRAREKEKLAGWSARGKAIQRRVIAFCVSRGFVKSSKSGFALLVDEHWVFWLRPLTRSGRRHIEIESGVRVLNSAWPGLHLNGIGLSGSSTEVNTWFVDSDESEDRCVADLCRYIAERVLPWHQKCTAARALLDDASPLMPEDRQCLRLALEGKGDLANTARSMELLGLRTAKEKGASPD